MASALHILVGRGNWPSSRKEQWELTKKPFNYVPRIFLLRASWLSHILSLEMIKVIKLISEAKIPRVSSEEDKDEAKRKSGNPGGAFLSTQWSKALSSVFQISKEIVIARDDFASRSSLDCLSTSYSIGRKPLLLPLVLIRQTNILRRV